MPVETNTEVSDHAATQTDAVSGADISGGTTFSVADVDRFTIFISGTAADSIKVEFSPDGGSSWYTPDESPVAIGSDGTLVVQVTYACTDVRLTNTTGTDATTVQVREVA